MSELYPEFALEHRLTPIVYACIYIAMSAIRRLSELRTDFLPLGIPELLPEGLRAGSLVECSGSGAGTLAFKLAAGLPCIVIDREQVFHPPAIGISPVVIHPPNERETLWTLDQCLRHPVAVIVRLDRLNASEFQRLKLAARHGGGCGLLLRPPRCPAFAAVRFQVQRVGNRLRIDIHPYQRTAILELNDETLSVRLVRRPIAAARAEPATA